MPREDLRAYFRHAADRWIEGVELQLSRLADGDGDVFFDCNFLIVCVQRLREVGRMALRRVEIKELAAALQSFDEAHPEFRDVRDYQEHILDPAMVGSCMYFAGGALTRLYGDGRAETIIDPVSLGKDARELHDAICTALGPFATSEGPWIIRPPDKSRR